MPDSVDSLLNQSTDEYSAPEHEEHEEEDDEEEEPTTVLISEEGRITSVNITEERLDLTCGFPMLEGPSTTEFLWEVELARAGAEDLVFDLTLDGPKDWYVYAVEDRYNKDKQISAIRINRFSVQETIAIIAIAPYWTYPDAGDYTITLEAVSGDINASIDLTATIVNNYQLYSQTELSGGRTRIYAKAGEDSIFPISVTNTGTASLDTINLSSTNPEGWTVTYSPAKLENLSPGASQQIEVSVLADKDTIPGDYMVSLEISGEPTAHATDLLMRVTVESSNRAILIAIVVIIVVAVALYFGIKEFRKRRTA
jgi:uncharacterized membrane protein